MKLVIAEKPAVAMSLATVLGATERKDGYLEGSGYLVSWCVGHLLELAQPEAYKEQYAKWRYEDLPILPENWKYEVPKDKKSQLALLCRLMKDKRVDSVVCATDAGREGELIFRLVYEYAGCKKPMERLWISSMEDAAIREGFDHLHPGSDYDKLYDAAVCRAGADWLIGINATRLFSVLYGVTLNVGRVMSPTLALLVQRESDIESFISKPFYVPEITCGGFTASGEKMTERSEAEKIRAELLRIETDSRKLIDRLIDADDVLFGYIQERIGKLHSTKNELEKKLMLVDRRVKKIDTKPLLDPLNRWDTLTVEEKNNLARMMIEKIYISTEKGVDIHYYF